MTSLTSVNLFDNKVAGGIPNSIGKLCNLKKFYLFVNDMTGSLPEFLEGTKNCLYRSPLPSLQFLKLSNNHLHGTLPNWLGQLENLIELGLGFNSLQGPIPASLGSFLHLTQLVLGGNELNWTLPVSLGKLSELHLFNVSFNHLTRILNESHFSHLKKLRVLLLSSNSFTLKVNSHWIPPFQLWKLEMDSCHLGPSFPSWLKSQNELTTLSMSNTSISGSIPNWFWKISSRLSLLNVSFNHLHGRLPNRLNDPHAVGEISLLDLSNNRFSGPIPRNIGASMPNLFFLSISGNQIIIDIPRSIGDILFLEVIDFSRNN